MNPWRDRLRHQECGKYRADAPRPGNMDEDMDNDEEVEDEQ